MLKSTYIPAKNKHSVREFLFSFFSKFKLNTIIGLAGPDINEYISFCKSKGYKEFELYENDVPTLVNQLKYIRHHKVSLTFGDIIKADASRQNVLFDLDYCVSVRHMKEHIQKFNDKFIMTFSTRIGVEETIESFFKMREEYILKEKDIEGPGLLNKMFTTKNGSYIFITYCDTSAMCCFAKIK